MIVLFSRGVHGKHPKHHLATIGNQSFNLVLQIHTADRSQVDPSSLNI